MASIKSFDLLRPGDRVVVFVRVSTRHQDYRAQLLWLLSKLYKRGTRVIKVYRCKCSGKTPPLQLQSAVWKARKTGATVVAFSIDRFIRHPDFDSKDPSTHSLEPDLRKLEANGVRLMVWTRTDAWGKLTKCGLWLNSFDRAGDRADGWTTRRRKRLRHVVQGLRQDGFRWGQILTWLNVPIPTMKSWMNSVEQNGWISKR